MLTINYYTAYRRDYKRMMRRGRNKETLKNVVTSLAVEEPLPPQNRDHALLGKWTGCRECHVEPDWLLIYRCTDGVLNLIRTGTHSDLFGR